MAYRGSNRDGDSRWRSQDRDYGRRGRDDDRGFFERAGERVRDWFDDDDERSRNWSSRDSQDDYGYPDQYATGGWGNQQGWQSRGRFAGTGSFGGATSSRSGSLAAGYRDDDPQAPRGADRPHDRHYNAWRQRRIEELDRDYDEFRREHQSKFEEEFGGWRQKRQGQRAMLGQVSEHMEVIGADGQHIGTVDKVRGDRIILTKSDPASGGIHHSIPCGWIDAVDDKVKVSRTSEQAMREWRDEEHSRALFEGGDQGRGGPHLLNRSFSGTY